MKQPSRDKEIKVYAYWSGIKDPALLGVLNCSFIRGKEIFSFVYDNEWLAKGNFLFLDPDLMSFSGPQFIKDEKVNFGLFLDSSPDRWGRLLMRRRESILARKEQRNERTLSESDYLLGVQDEQRLGGIRFKLEIGGNFLDDNKELTTPPFSSIKDLQYAADIFESTEASNDPEYLKWINLLIAPGSSIGGTRPKAGVSDDKGNLWIAKFPSRNDINDVGALEFIVHQFAAASGINVPAAEARIFLGKYHTFLIKRFDRIDSGERIHFASAMTCLGYTDGVSYHDGVSYLEIAEFISRNGASPDEDLEELWRRILFNICVKNCDDHLRNHGFILTREGWRLSPAYDMNTVATGTGLSLNISENDNSLDPALAFETAEYFRVSNTKAKEIYSVIKSSLNNWQKLTRKLKLSKSDIDSIMTIQHND